MSELEEHIAEIGACFAINGSFVSGEEIESGHINTTYLATYEEEGEGEFSYILQRINEHVFKDPHAVIQNVSRVTRHINRKVLRRKKDAGGQTLNLYPGRDGKVSVQGPSGGVWRCYNFIEGCATYDVVENTRQAYEAGKAFGAFQDLVSDLPTDRIVETIPDFHNTRVRYARLIKVIEADPCGRVASVPEEIAFIREREGIVGKLLDLVDTGELSERITHNDTKLNNVMIDKETDEAVCVIDLDTVMPGLPLYDFGDLVRTATSPAEEDEKDLSKVTMRMSMFEPLVEGYLATAQGFLSPLEIELLPFSGRLISLEVGIRFLTDYLEGDVYFKVHHEGHNLDRCRTQLTLVKSIEEQEGAMTSFIKKVTS
ncbi:aminoglycoside phosphotransferase family protein [Akkermansiaceae bacterium]|nr:aminoglycoside phosphotransferase family protein [Akkermansiaceae bacterium]MDB4425801.1 aminoglycoside phosphotransferase family protein [bacterium]MDB4569740.1 aminoglycoside phosphotransferase family protein [Akkermansiaceae bacterium]MDB4771232.1 aminoglycoside phosphotransferase family protein [Akkermansiaceae bacterium]